jgi:hypothetical protein
VRRVELSQLASRYVRNVRKPLALASLEQGLRIGAAEALDHVVEVITLNVMRQASEV